jgi:hypothetical protein
MALQTQPRAFQYTAVHCTALYCPPGMRFPVLYCIVLHYTALHCTALPSWNALPCAVLYCTALHCTALHCTALLECASLCCIVLYTALLHSNYNLSPSLTCTSLYFTTLIHFLSLNFFSMGIPMLTVGIRRYTNTDNRGFAFGLFYSVMNIAAFVSGKPRIIITIIEVQCEESSLY